MVKHAELNVMQSRVGNWHDTEKCESEEVLLEKGWLRLAKAALHLQVLKTKGSFVFAPVSRIR